MVDQRMKSCFCKRHIQSGPTGQGVGNVATNPGEASISSLSVLCDITKGRIAQLTKEKDDLFPFLRGCSTGNKHVTNRKHCLQINNICQW